MNNIVETLNAHWSEVIDSVITELSLTKISGDIWLKPLRIHDVEDNTIFITTDNEQYDYNYVSKKYGIHIKSAVSEILNDNYDIVFLSSSELTTPKSTEKEEVPAEKNLYSINLNPNYTFDNFIQSPSSDIAYATAVAVAESPGEFYNPLVIWGGVGLGKTHLMQSIAHFIIGQDPKKKVLYVTSETFVNDLIQSINKKSQEELRKKYRDIDVLLIDDIQFIEKKVASQIEFFNTFNKLYESKKQIVVTSDRPPKDLTELEDRIRSRFQQGYEVDIQPPTYETRMAILKKWTETEGLSFQDDVLSYIAHNVTDNIRVLQGAWKKITAFLRLQRLKSEDITLERAQDALKTIINPNEKRKIDLSLIADIVAEHYEISVKDIFSKKRSNDVAYPRQIVMYLCNDLTSMHVTDIGKQLDKHHSTIIHGIQTIKDDMKEDPKLVETINVIKKKINPQ